MKKEHTIQSRYLLHTAWMPAALLFCAFIMVPLSAADDAAAAIDTLIGRMPVNTAAEKEKIVAGLLDLGEAGVRELCSRIKDQEEPLDGKVCAALFGLEHAACRKGNEKMRRIVADVFCEILKSDAAIAAKSHLLTELRCVGQDESVDAVGSLLTDKDLCEKASQTLVAIGTDQAAKALRNALPKVILAQRVTIICSLGRMRDTNAVPLLLEEAVHNNADVRHAALFALSEIGDPKAGKILRKAAASGDDGAAEKADHRLLRFAVNLSERGNKNEAIAICRELVKKADPTERGIGSGAFSELLSLLDKKDALKEIQAVVARQKPKTAPPPAEIKRSKPASIRVYVAFDERAEKLPGWLKGWKDTGEKLETSDVGFNVYTTDFSQKSITLGGNDIGSKSQSHYIIILTGLAGGPVREEAPAAKKVLNLIKNDALRNDAEKLITGSVKPAVRAQAEPGIYIAGVSTGAACKLVPNGLKTGVRVYIDRDYVFEKVPGNLKGESYVMGSNEDKGCSAEKYITLVKGKQPAGLKMIRKVETGKKLVKAQMAGSQAPVPALLKGKLFTAYHFSDADRPYFYPVVAPTGDNITRHWPMKDINKDEARDHRHHRSIWFTHGDVNGHDFWSEGRGPKIVQTNLVTETGENETVIIAENEWRAKNGDIVCTDARRHTIHACGDNRIIDFEITIKASHGRVVLGDTKEGSMSMRVAPTLRTNGNIAQGSMVNSEGGSGKGIWGKHARWCDYYGPLNGKTVGIAIMDHPDNPRHPTTWHARDYGLCAANPFGLSYFEGKPRGTGDMVVEKGKSVTFKYRVVVHNGTPEEAAIEKLYQEYASGPELQSIFNGKDFEGWKVPGNNIWWEVHGGMISVKSGPKKSGNALWTEKSYKNFVLELDFRYGEGIVDTGIYLRTSRHQVQLGISGSLKRDMTGSMYIAGKGYPQEAKGVKELLKPRDWNSMKVQAIGSLYTIWLNGKKVSTYKAKKVIDEGPIGLQLHGGKEMAADFRNIRIAELPGN